MKLKKGDEIIIRSGKDKGKKGKIEKIFPKRGEVLLPNLNVYKKHLKKRGENSPSGIIEFNRPLKISKVALVCPKCSKATRIGFLIKGKEKTRICQKCQAKI